MSNGNKFDGFSNPEQNWSKLPHELIGALDKITTLGEMKVIIYTLRHTYGYHDDYKKITLDEFQNGRKRKDGSRIDNGTGLTKPTIIAGIKRAVTNGFLFEHVDSSDLARVKKFYSLAKQGLKIFTPDVKNLYTGCKEILHRTEKETLEKETLLEKDSKNKTSDSSTGCFIGQPLDSEIQINLDLPAYNHFDLPNKWIHVKDKDGNLVEAFVTMATPKKLRIAIPGVDGTKLVSPEKVFYQNGYPELQPVVVGVDNSESKLTPAELEMKSKLISLTGAGDKLTKSERIAEIKKCQEAAIFMVKRGDTIADVNSFELWYPSHWQGEQGNSITLKTISSLWSEFKERKSGFTRYTDRESEIIEEEESPKEKRMRENGGIDPIALENARKAKKQYKSSMPFLPSEY